MIHTTYSENYQTPSPILLVIQEFSSLLSIHLGQIHNISELQYKLDTQYFKINKEI